VVAMRDAVQSAGITIRAGLHAGEIEPMEHDDRRDRRSHRIARRSNVRCRCPRDRDHGEGVYVNFLGGPTGEESASSSP